jgi:LemA protein
MTGSLLLWFFLACAVFWSVGLYNRLTRIRARGLDAFGSAEKYMRQITELVDAHIVRSGFAGIQVQDVQEDPLAAAWIALHVQLGNLAKQASEVRATPLAVQSLVNLQGAMTKVQQAWDALLQQPADLVGPPVPAELQQQWDIAYSKYQNARGGFNQILAKYNEAIEEFPARLISGILGFKAAGRM